MAPDWEVEVVKSCCIMFEGLGAGGRDAAAQVLRYSLFSLTHVGPDTVLEGQWSSLDAENVLHKDPCVKALEHGGHQEVSHCGKKHGHLKLRIKKPSILSHDMMCSSFLTWPRGGSQLFGVYNLVSLAIHIFSHPLFFVSERVLAELVGENGSLNSGESPVNVWGN